MKLGNPVDFTYMNYLHSAHYADDIIDEREVQEMCSNFKPVSGFLSQMCPLFVVIDYARMNYVSITESTKTVLGYHPTGFLENGLGFMLNIMDNDFFKTYNQKLFPSNIEFLKSIPQAEHANYTFSFNFRIKNIGGSWIDLYQRSTFITSKETGLPLYCLAVGFDITAFKKDSVMIRTIEKSEHGKISSMIETDYFYPYEEDTLLTKQEKNILKWMIDGLSSKMIAAKLSISENTISNHRQNMLRKTNTKNVAQLVAFAISNRII
ncbi:MAG TPA: helix-turn-helix transcriptional regulator [Ferruginibacter sp.]|jgi:DNA-binding CsgD family transcriptional regulator|nr:helix-turn-helix transcriptional regulator [Ferruginibacter sp.]